MIEPLDVLSAFDLTVKKSALLLFSALLAAASVRAQDSGLRSSLESSYAAFRAAMIQQDARSWAGTITMYRQVVTRNQIVSRGMPFPKSVFESPLAPPGVDNLRLLEAQAVGDTAHLLYFGKVDMGGAPEVIPENLLMLKFFRERGTWKFDSTKLLHLRDQPDIKAQINEGKELKFLDYPEFTPPGTPPAVPPICNPPQNVTGCTLQSHGYETKLTVNGFDHPVLRDDSNKFFVLGGLNNGTNDLVLSIQPTEVPEGQERLLQVDLFVPNKTPGKPGVRVFHFESKDPKLQGVKRFDVPVNASVLLEGR